MNTIYIFAQVLSNSINLLSHGISPSAAWVVSIRWGNSSWTHKWSKLDIWPQVSPKLLYDQLNIWWGGGGVGPTYIFSAVIPIFIGAVHGSVSKYYNPRPLRSVPRLYIKYDIYFDVRIVWGLKLRCEDKVVDNWTLLPAIPAKFKRLKFYNRMYGKYMKVFCVSCN